MVGTELNTLITSVNGDEEIEASLAQSLVNIGKAILEGEHDWMPLKTTNSTISFSAGSTWQTPYSLATITDFLRFQNCDFPIKVFDGNNQVEYYRQVAWKDRLYFKDVNNTFVYDEANNTAYFNGTHAIGGTLYVEYIKDTTRIDLTSSVDLKVAGSFPFPSRYHDILAFYAVGVSKGAIDYDEINKQMLPANQAVLTALKSAMKSWDTAKQSVEVSTSDPYRNRSDGFRSNHINLNG